MTFFFNIPIPSAIDFRSHKSPKSRPVSSNVRNLKIASKNVSYFALALVILLAIPLESKALPFRSQKIILAGPNRLALEAGRRVAKMGGNVVDAAVATELGLAVTSPYFASLGGGGFAMIKIGKDIEALDFRESAPKATSPDYYLNKPDDASETGGTAVGIPGVPAGLWAMHKKYGKLHWSQLFKDAIGYAESGFQLGTEFCEKLDEEKGRFNDSAKKYFLKSANHNSYLPGDILIQRPLAQVLKEMRNRGPVAFYGGTVAHDIVNSVQSSGGHMSLQDLANYKVRWLTPMKARFQGYDFSLMPPPSSGGVVLSTALKLIEMIELPKKAALSVDELHGLAGVLQASFRGRALLGDPDFVKNPVELLLSNSELEKIAKTIRDSKNSIHLPPINEPKISMIETCHGKAANFNCHETTHFSIMDNEGNTVALTVTLNGNFGSGVATSQYGIMLNNEMDDFTTHPGKPNQFGLIQGIANQVEPGKRPLSSMSPTIIEKNGETIMSLGSPGGPRIISAVLQTLYRVLVSNYDMDLAIQTPRIHHQFLPDTLFVDSKRFFPDVLSELKARGHKIEEGKIAKVYGVRRTNNNLLEGAFDSRGEGDVEGY